MNTLSLWLNKKNTFLWQRVVLSTNADSKSLSVLRILTGLFLLCLSFLNFVWIGTVPQAFFDPPIVSLTNFASGFPGTAFFFGIDIILIAAATCITIGLKTRLSSIIYFVAAIIAINFSYSFGKIGHSSVFYLSLLIIMSFSDWGHHLALVPDKLKSPAVNAKCLALLSVILCFAFFTAGLEKALNWINLDFNKNGSGAWFYNQFNSMRHYLLAPYMGKYFPFWGFKIMDYIAVVFELTPLVCLLISRKAWRLWLIIACLFHIGNVLMFNINFIYLSILYMAYVDYSSIYASLVKMAKTTVFKISTVMLFVAIICVRVYYLINDIHAPNILLPNLPEYNLYFSLVFWSFVIYLLVKSIKAQPAAGSLKN
jgi:hypothetical protein